jgi:hypothetical protein
MLNVTKAFDKRAKIEPEWRLVMIGSDDQAQFFVGWGTSSLINAGLAQSKNRNGLLWWITSLFFGPMATFLIVILGRVGPPTV